MARPAAKPAVDLGPLEALRAAQEEIGTLQRKVGQQEVELDFFRRACVRFTGYPSYD
jgi:hypothetical protein